MALHNNNNNNRPSAAAAAVEPSVQQAREYVADVKRALGPSSDEYHVFLSTLKGYRTQQLTPQEVIRRISNLFRGQRRLIFGFNAFLPQEYQIEEQHYVDVGRGVQFASPIATNSQQGYAIA